jgi:hypothetical protein
MIAFPYTICHMHGTHRTVLLAIIYVLSRTENMQCPPMDLSNIDLGDVRAQRLSLTPPHIIECAAAGEGGSQKACHLPRKKRYASVGQKGITLWMTGLSGSGKSTIAKALEEELVLKHGKHVYRLDGDNIRTGLNRVRAASRSLLALLSSCSSSHIALLEPALSPCDSRPLVSSQSGPGFQCLGSGRERPSRWGAGMSDE